MISFVVYTKENVISTKLLFSVTRKDSHVIPFTTYYRAESKVTLVSVESRQFSTFYTVKACVPFYYPYIRYFSVQLNGHLLNA